MGETEAEIGGADETIVLEGKEFTIRPTLGMALAFSRAQGGIHGAVLRCIGLDFDTITEAVKLGCDDIRKGFEVPMMSQKQKAAAQDRLQQAIYDTGLRAVGTAVVAVLGSLANGGRRPETEQKAEPGDGKDEGGGDPLGAAASAD